MVHYPHVDIALSMGLPNILFVMPAKDQPTCPLGADPAGADANTGRQQAVDQRPIPGRAAS
jgi:hypothetical protein